MLIIDRDSCYSPGDFESAPMDSSGLITKEEAVELLSEIAEDGFKKEYDSDASENIFAVLWKNGSKGHGFAGPPYMIAMALGEYELASKIVDRMNSFSEMVLCTNFLMEFIYDEAEQAYGSIRKVNLAGWLFNSDELPFELVKKIFVKSSINTGSMGFLSPGWWSEWLLVAALPGDPMPAAFKRDLKGYPGFTYVPLPELKKKCISRFIKCKKKLLAEIPEARVCYVRAFRIWSSAFRDVPESELRLYLMQHDSKDEELLRIWINVLYEDIVGYMRGHSWYDHVNRNTSRDVVVLIERVKSILYKSTLSKNEADAAVMFLCVALLVHGGSDGTYHRSKADMERAVMKIIDPGSIDVADVLSRVMRILFCVKDYSVRLHDIIVPGLSLTEHETYKCLDSFRRLLGKRYLKNGITVNIDNDWYSAICRDMYTEEELKQPIELTTEINGEYYEMALENARIHMETLLHFADRFTVDPKCRKDRKHKYVLQLMLWLDREDLLRQAVEKGLLSKQDINVMKKAVLDSKESSKLTPYMIFMTQKGA